MWYIVSWTIHFTTTTLPAASSPQRHQPFYHHNIASHFITTAPSAISPPQHRQHFTTTTPPATLSPQHRQLLHSTITRVTTHTTTSHHHPDTTSHFSTPTPLVASSPRYTQNRYQLCNQLLRKIKTCNKMQHCLFRATNEKNISGAFE